MYFRILYIFAYIYVGASFPIRATAAKGLKKEKWQCYNNVQHAIDTS